MQSIAILNYTTAPGSSGNLHELYYLHIIGICFKTTWKLYIFCIKRAALKYLVMARWNGDNAGSEQGECVNLGDLESLVSIFPCERCPEKTLEGWTNLEPWHLSLFHPSPGPLHCIHPLITALWPRVGDCVLIVLKNTAPTRAAILSHGMERPM